MATQGNNSKRLNDTSVSPESLITEHLNIWTSALKPKTSAGRGRGKGSGNGKYELYGIKKLRELILELAVRGLLVPQDPNDEPASELLRKIFNAKEKLVNEGRLKKQKKLKPILQSEIPYTLPESWAWERLGNITNYGQTEKVESEQAEKNTWVLELEDIEKETSNLLQKKRFAEREFRSSKNVFQVGDVIYGKLRPYLDKVLIADEDGVCTTEMIPLRAHAKISSEYLRLTLKSPHFKEYANSSTHGMNLPRLGTEKAREALIPICCERQQIAIAERVDELMTLCDQLEDQTEQSIEAHKELVETLLNVLTNAKDHQAFSQAWERIAENFDVLFTTEDSIEQLKQTILQLAVMGKLVPQDPNDEPASELLKKIALEKQKLIEEGKIKKQKPLPPITDEEKPFDLPTGWDTVRLGALLPELQNGASSRGDSKGKEVVVVRLADIDDWKISLFNPRRLVIGEESIKRYSLCKDDILIIRVNGSSDIVGRFILCEKDIDAIYCDHFIRLRFPLKVFDSQYLVVLGASSLIRERIEDMFVSTAGQKTVNQKHISSLVLGLPPVVEQKRIINRVNELMAICELLKQKITSSKELQLSLADVVAKLNR